MDVPFACHMVLIVGALSLGACSRSSSNAKPDAGQTAPSATVVRPRPPAKPGETLADLAKSKVTMKMIKDRDTTSPVVANVALRDGAVTLEGSPSARLTIDLDTFDSMIPLRNERVRLVFFESSGVGWDVIELAVPKIPESVLADLKAKKSVSGAKLDGRVKLHGKEATVPLVVDATWAGERLVVKSTAAIAVKISDFGLNDNLRRLSALCMHDSIDDVVNVEATVEFAP